MQQLLQEIRDCTHCINQLPFGPRPIIAGTPKSKIVLASQAPGRLAHEHNKAWDDPSGKNLRQWLGVTETVFYNPDNFAILPAGFCYPGKGSTGDLPPKKDCAPLWHQKVWNELHSVKLTLLIGKYAQDLYLPKNAKGTLTENVRDFENFLPKYFPLPHPSPVNHFWMRKNPWFETDVNPRIQELVSRILSGEAD
ncbi:MAG: uracil-DNA glycosylase family protein [Bacteroidota bacterium]